VPAELVAAQPDRVTWSPSLTTAEVSRALDEATLLVLPSRSEGLGRVIVEAFCRGRCVVGSRVGGIPDIVVDGETGLLVPPGQPDSLAGALERALVEPQLAARLGASARDAVGAWLATPEQYAHRVRALVDTVCETPRSAG
jgi:starch synthase